MPAEGLAGVPSVDVRGSAPGTRETDLLRPTNLVSEVHAILLGGGSAFGLGAASGVARYLEERGVGAAAVLCTSRAIVRGVSSARGLGCVPGVSELAGRAEGGP